jgi:hypothetical protein
MGDFFYFFLIFREGKTTNKVSITSALKNSETQKANVVHAQLLEAAFNVFWVDGYSLALNQSFLLSRFFLFFIFYFLFFIFYFLFLYQYLTTNKHLFV